MWEQAKARRDHGRQFAADIRYEAASLVRIDQDLAVKLPAASRPLRELRFDDGANHADGQRGHVQFADDKHDGHIQLVDNASGGDPQLPRHDPPFTRWNGPPPPGWHQGTGYWAVDMDHPSNSPNPLPAQSLYQSNPPCVRPDLLTGPPTGVTSIGGGSDNPQKGKATGLDLQGTSRVRVVGTTFNGIAQMVQVDGHWYQAQWQEYQYQMNTIPVWQGTGNLGGITLPDMGQANVWRPVSLGQIIQASTVYPEATFYLPDLDGGSVQIKRGDFVAGPAPSIPTPPVMTRGPY